ncbi:MAG: hypothetical protein H6R19_2252 [Proteobacteria bacterium]|nr:hypothetical protein [Pseudomonadota bacterium]
MRVRQWGDFSRAESSLLVDFVHLNCKPVLLRMSFDGLLAPLAMILERLFKHSLSFKTSRSCAALHHSAVIRRKVRVCV